MYTFQERVPAQSLQARLRRIGDLTVPNIPPCGESTREIQRHNRSIPTLLCPSKNGVADVSRCTIAITKDIGDEGIGLLLTHPVSGPEVLVGYLLPDPEMNRPWFFRGTIQHNTPIGGGFWVVGIALQEFFSAQRHSSLIELEPLTQKLLPPPASGE